MSLLLLIKNGLDRLLDLIVIGVFAALVIIVALQVLFRYGPELPIDLVDGTEELATFLMIWVGLLGACVALRQRAHLGIDYLVDKFSVRGRLAAEIFGYAVVALFSFFVLVGGGGILVRLVVENDQRSPAMGIPMGIVYGALPVSGFFLTLYSLAMLCEVLKRKGGETPEGGERLPPERGRPIE